MACRITTARFQAMMDEEALKLGLKNPPLALMNHDPLEPFSLAEVVDVDAPGDETAGLDRKAIQSLVDEAEQARPIVRNLLRWAKEHGAK